MAYIIDSKPHDDDIFISLEYFNEGAVVLLCFMMFIYSGIVPGREILTNKIPLYISIGITVLIVVCNFGVMIRNAFKKLMLMIIKSQH